jgi:hypothetical protein
MMSSCFARAAEAAACCARLVRGTKMLGPIATPAAAVMNCRLESFNASLLSSVEHQ